MRIAFFFEIFYPQINGVVTSTVNLALNLISRGHEITFFAPRTKGFDENRVHGQIETVYLESVPFPAYPGMSVTLPWSRRVVSRIRRENIDVLHFTGPFTLGLNAINASRQLDLPLVQTFHTLLQDASYIKYVTKVDLPKGELLSWQYIGLYVKASDVITCPSRYVLDAVRKKFPGSRYEHISNGLDLESFQHPPTLATVASCYPGYNNKSFLFIGRLGHEKSIDVLIRSFARARETDRELRLFLVGDGPQAQELKDLAAKTSARRSIFFLGRLPHDDLVRSGLIQHARAFVTASKSEIQSMTVLEAIACGTPLILAEVSAMREIIDGNGLFFPPDDEAALAERLLRVAGDDGLCSDFRERTTRMARDYDGRVVAEKFERLYSSLL
jgi:glycosyltransferase involved in cell wall biosynthesis